MSRGCGLRDALIMFRSYLHYVRGFMGACMHYELLLYCLSHQPFGLRTWRLNHGKFGLSKFGLNKFGLSKLGLSKPNLLLVMCAQPTSSIVLRDSYTFSHCILVHLVYHSSDTTPTLPLSRASRAPSCLWPMLKEFRRFIFDAEVPTHQREPALPRSVLITVRFFL